MVFWEGHVGGNDISGKNETVPEVNSVFGGSVHSISKYWLDAKSDPGSKSRRKKSFRKDPSKVIKYRKLLPLAKVVPRWQTDRSMSAGGEAAVLISLLVQPPLALERIKEAGLRSSSVCHGVPSLPTEFGCSQQTPWKLPRAGCCPGSCCWLFLMASPGSSETPLDFSGARNWASVQLKRVLH